MFLSSYSIIWYFNFYFPADLSYSLTSSTPNDGKLGVDPNTGDVYIAQALDYETVTSYALVITASDKGTVKNKIVYLTIKC